MSAIPHPLLTRCGVEHGFGVRGSRPQNVVLARQVHGSRAVQVGAESPPNAPDALGEADALVCAEPGVCIGVVTADCVPILAASVDGGSVAAVHAGWRGLARGVIAAGLDELRGVASGGAELVAVIGPHIGPCCYEVDAPVLDALAAAHPRLEAALRPARAGHAYLDLGALARAALIEWGVAPANAALLPDACTACDVARFHSHRREGPERGRLVHVISARSAEA